MIAEVAFPVPIHKTFHYKVPPGMHESLKAGMRVRAPFGRRRLVGVVTDIHDHEGGAQVWVSVLRELETAVDPFPLYGPELMELGHWMSSTWGSPIGVALSALLPACACKTPAESNERNKSNKSNERNKSTFELTPGQKSVLETLKEMLCCENFGAALLFGTSVTGKTEVYIRLIQEVLAGRGQTLQSRAVPAELAKQGQSLQAGQSFAEGGGQSAIPGSIGKRQSFAEGGGQALFLVPDIALTEPFLDEIFSRFDPSLITCWHSRMTPAARRTAWSEIASGEKRVVLGTRSACLLPFRALSLAIIDEEQDESYKQEEFTPNYHARDVLLWRARRHSALVVAGSATPSLESYQAALLGKWKLLRLTERVSTLKSFPEVIVVDRRKEPGKLISDVMAGHLKEVMARKEQSILLTNRRGYSGSFVCLNCGWLVRCDKCAVAMSLHRSETKNRVLVCHRCGARKPPPEICPKCSNRIFKCPGAGTQKVEQEVLGIVPQARIVRLDSDTSRRSGGQGRQAYKRFSGLEAEILIGTRAVSRGYHFPDVTFIGVVDADTELHSPDFRAAEKTVQMLCQAQGRTGRAEKPGKMVIQTFDPDNYAFSGVTASDYEKFARHELEIRSQLGYPPFRRLLRCVVCARDENRARNQAQGMADSLIRSVKESGLLSSENIDMLGPVQCGRKSAGLNRYHFIVKSLSERGIIFCSEHLKKAKSPKGTKIKLFTDPYDFR